MVGLLLDEIGESIPANTPHAVSVSLPTWKANVGYEEGEEWVLSKMRTGYPRFFIHQAISKFAHAIVQVFGSPDERALLFPSRPIADRCVEFLRTHDDSSLVLDNVRVVDLVANRRTGKDDAVADPYPTISAVLFPACAASTAKSFWQHTGEGVSSRRAEFCHRLFEDGLLVRKPLLNDLPRSCRGPKRYRRKSSSGEKSRRQSTDENGRTNGPEGGIAGDSEGREYSLHVDERYGRHLNPFLLADANVAIKRRIAGSLTADVALKEAIDLPGNPETARVPGRFSEEDVYLFPTGMSAIFNVHRILQVDSPLKTVCFGFPYIDTLKILQKWGHGCLFYGNGSSTDLDDLETRLKDGERYLALFCEFPSNPLLRSPNLERIRRLADLYDFAVVIDETVGNFLNVHVLPLVDVVVSSLTKVFSGDSNVMGGSAVLNPRSKRYGMLKERMKVEYEDNYWSEDVIVMERNSRDFASRIARINKNAEAICDVLRASPRVKNIFYPKHSPTRCFYDRCRRPSGGYGGLLSVTFFSQAEAVTFFDHLETAKGPSLGTNFTLSCPYTLLAHYGELDWAASFGVEADLVRVSVGLENPSELTSVFRRALAAVESLGHSPGFHPHEEMFNPRS